MASASVEMNPRFLRSVLAASEDCIKVLDLDGRLTFMSEGGQHIMEISDFNAVRDCPWPDFWRDIGNEHAKAAVEAARRGKSYRFQGEAGTFLGNPRYWDVQVSPILDDGGRPEAILSVSRDITKMKETEDKIRFLALELEHRVKNIVALIHGIAKQSFSPGITAEDAFDRLSGRLIALGSAHDLLMKVSASAGLSDIVRAATEMHGARRFAIGGPELRLSSKAALAVALALHELSTNAVKYGSLSNTDGKVNIAWTAEGDSFSLDWVEEGGPQVVSPTTTGFGTRMISKALAAYLQGTGEMTYAPAGLRFKLTAPLAALTDV